MGDLTPRQREVRSRTERLIGLAAPVLDLLLGVGERISRVAEPTDHEYYPIQPGLRRRLPSPASRLERPGTGDGARAPRDGEPEPPADQP